jgi:hypothetical protein
LFLELRVSNNQEMRRTLVLQSDSVVFPNRWTHALFEFDAPVNKLQLFQDLHVVAEFDGDVGGLVRTRATQRVQ